MRILVVGAGAIGGYFGGRLVEAGQDVTFLVRPHRREQLAATGLCLKSVKGDFQAPVKTVLKEDLDEPYDLVILACKAYDLDNAIASFTPAMGVHSAVLPLLNGMRHIDRLVERFGEWAVLGGLCAIAATVDAEGRIIHMNDAHGFIFGKRAGGPSVRVAAISEAVAKANFDGRASAIILQEMWEKWVFLASLASINCLMRSAVGDIVAAGGTDTVIRLHEEIRSIAEHAGYDPRPDVHEKARAVLTAKGSTLTASMLRDLEKGGPIEADHVVGDLLERGRAAGLDLPLLNLAYIHLKAFEARRARS